MIKIIYESKPYYYDSIKDGQAYGINTVIEMNEDASLGEIIEAVVRLAKFAGFYHAKKETFLEAIEDVFAEMGE